jgi:hypothetical protein
VSAQSLRSKYTVGREYTLPGRRRRRRRVGS